MKTREIFQQIRNQKGGDSLRLRLTLLVSAEIVVSILLALGLYYLLADMIPMDDTWLLLLDLIVISLVVGSVVTLVMSRYFFDPIKKLGKAMEQVADGDFSVRLDKKSSSKEIMEVYTGFNMMAHELSATEILQTDFVSNVSHEFKTPINAIEGYCMLLQGSENMSAEQQAYIHKIVFNTHRLSSLVGSILLLSKLENQQIPTGQTRFRLDEQIRQSIVALEPAWEKKDLEFDVVVGAESRGFIFGTPVAYELHKSFVPARKPGKLPRETVSREYELEYGKGTIELHKDSIKPGQKVVIIDDLIATGGTVEAIAKLVEELGGEVVKICFVMELAGLEGRKKLEGYKVESALIYEGK